METQRGWVVEVDGVTMYAFPEDGAFFGVEDETLMVAPMNVDGSVDAGSIGEVEDFIDRAFVDRMVKFFGATFWAPDFLQVKNRPEDFGMPVE